MATELARCIEQLRLCNTHEHMRKEDAWLKDQPDILCELFENYVPADLRVAGADEAAVKRLLDANDPEIEARFRGVEEAWKVVRFTGYGEAVRICARRFFGLENLEARALADAQAKLPRAWPAGSRLKILRDEGLYDHIQTDDFCWPCRPDASGPEFFFYDLSWANFCNGDLKQRKDLKEGTDDRCELLFQETGVQVKNLESLREALAKLFETYAPYAVAVKAQHAYNRTLVWRERSEAEAAAALAAVLKDPEAAGVEQRNALGDWCWARGVELSIHHHLPFKIHTGSYAGHNYLVIDRVRAGHLCPLLIKYPKARFVLMHIAVPYDDELVAIAKHFSNVWVDLCWAWSMNPHGAAQFVRRFLHAAPINKLFGFGGDTSRPRASVAYAMQARKWLTRALQAEVDDGELSEREAIGVAQALLQDNQRACFDLEGLRKRLRECLARST